MSVSPLKPTVEGPLSWAGISSLRTYLSGSSTSISNSIGTRLLPRTCCVRPMATIVLTADRRLSPSSASRVAARIAVGSGGALCARSATETANAQTIDFMIGLRRWRPGGGLHGLAIREARHQAHRVLTSDRIHVATTETVGEEALYRVRPRPVRVIRSVEDLRRGHQLRQRRERCGIV